jgi:hypothetical protein
MLSNPFRALGTVATVLFTAGLTWAVTLGGYSLNDPEIEEERAWVQGFKQDQPDLARKSGLQCRDEIGRSPWTRDGGMALFRCIRAKGEANGHYYE